MKTRFFILALALLTFSSCASLATLADTGDQKYQDAIYYRPQTNAPVIEFAQQTASEELISKTKDSRIFVKTIGKVDTLVVPKNMSARLTFHNDSTTTVSLYDSSWLDDCWDWNWHSHFAYSSWIDPWFYRPGFYGYHAFYSPFYGPYYGFHPSYYYSPFWYDYAFNPWFYDPWYYDPWFYGPVWSVHFPGYYPWNYYAYAGGGHIHLDRPLLRPEVKSVPSRSVAGVGRSVSSGRVSTASSSSSRASASRSVSSRPSSTERPIASASASRRPAAASRPISRSVSTGSSVSISSGSPSSTAASSVSGSISSTSRPGSSATRSVGSASSASAVRSTGTSSETYRRSSVYNNSSVSSGASRSSAYRNVETGGSFSNPARSAGSSSSVSRSAGSYSGPSSSGGFSSGRSSSSMGGSVSRSAGSSAGGRR